MPGGRGAVWASGSAPGRWPAPSARPGTVPTGGVRTRTSARVLVHQMGLETHVFVEVPLLVGVLAALLELHQPLVGAGRELRPQAHVLVRLEPARAPLEHPQLQAEQGWCWAFSFGVINNKNG